MRSWPRSAAGRRLVAADERHGHPPRVLRVAVLGVASPRGIRDRGVRRGVARERDLRRRRGVPVHRVVHRDRPAVEVVVQQRSLRLRERELHREIRVHGREAVVLDRRRVGIPLLDYAEAEEVLIEADMKREERKEIIDRQAAIVILQRYLDRISEEEGK